MRKPQFILEDDNFDPQAANISVKSEICMPQMTILSCVRLQNNASMARKTQPLQNTDNCTYIELIKVKSPHGRAATFTKFGKTFTQVPITESILFTRKFQIDFFIMPFRRKN